MEQDATKLNEMKARRDALRERLRAKCEKIVEAVEAMPDPKTFLEAERAARAVMVADKMVERVFSEPKVAKEDVRSRSQKVPVNAPIVSFAATSPLHCAVNSYVKGEDETIKAPSVTSSPDGFVALRCTNDSLDRSPAHPPYADAKGEDEIDETPLSKTCLKLEQIAAKIADLDAEFNGQKSAKQGP